MGITHVAHTRPLTHQSRPHTSHPTPDHPHTPRTHPSINRPTQCQFCPHTPHPHVPSTPTTGPHTCTLPRLPTRRAPLTRPQPPPPTHPPTTTHPRSRAVPVPRTASSASDTNAAPSHTLPPLFPGAALWLLPKALPPRTPTGTSYRIITLPAMPAGQIICQSDPRRQKYYSWGSALCCCLRLGDVFARVRTPAEKSWKKIVLPHAPPSCWAKSGRLWHAWN